MRKTYRLPSGEESGDPEQYTTEWERVGNQVAGALGIVLAGYDPGFLFRDGENVIDIPASIVMKIHALLGIGS